MKVFITTNTESIEGQEKSFFLLGVYKTKEDAIKGLNEQADIDMDNYDEEDRERYKRSDVSNGFILSDGYNNYEYYISEREIEEGSAV